MGDNSAPALDPAPSLIEEQRQVARDRLYRAAWAVLAERGLGATAEEVADAAGVSVRTVFRHFGTRDAMVAEVLRAQLRTYKDERLGPPAEGETLEAWLARLVASVHRRNAVLGRAYWELTALRSDLRGEIADAADERRVARGRLVRGIAAGAWAMAGGDGRPPASLTDVFAVHLSAFATQALIADYGRTPDQVAATSATAMAAVVRSAIRSRPS